MAKSQGIDAAELRRRRGQSRSQAHASKTLFARPTAATTLKPKTRKFGEKPKDPMRLPEDPKKLPKKLSGRQAVFFQRSTKHEGGLKRDRK